jgi:hypothetical protein
MHNVVATIKATDWNSAKNLAQKMNYWVYRGQSTPVWPLSTTLERHGSILNCPKNRRHIVELSVLRTFQRRTHDLISTPPKLTDKLEWLALIQHHGGPTRLLDFTFSFYVATFFAIETADSDAAIWCINLTRLQNAFHHPKRANRPLIDDSPNWNELRISNNAHANGFVGVDRAGCSNKFVLAVEPERMNERLAVQQGLFLTPSNIDCSFEENLSELCDISIRDYQQQLDQFTASDQGAGVNEFAAVRLILSRDTHKAAMKDLRAMNISASSLFPGIDGCARSLIQNLRFFENHEIGNEGFV